MKKTALGLGLAAILAMGTTAAFADDHDGRQMRGGGMERMVKHLELTPEQEVQLLELRHEREKTMLLRRQEMRANREAGEEMDREAMHAERQAGRAQMEADLKSILTDEQWSKFEERRAERMERGPRGKGPDGKRGMQDGDEDAS
jgi:periplasmic protein CpxP/Spy